MIDYNETFKASEKRQKEQDTRKWECVGCGPRVGGYFLFDSFPMAGPYCARCFHDHLIRKFSGSQL